MAVEQTVSQNVFEKAFSKAAPIHYDGRWANGTGYLNSFCQNSRKFNPAAPSLEEGEAVSFTDNLGRRAVGIGTRFGNIVVFERHSPKFSEIDEPIRGRIFVYNATSEFRELGLNISSTTLSEQDLIYLLGDEWVDNIGIKLANMAKCFETARQPLTFKMVTDKILDCFNKRNSEICTKNYIIEESTIKKLLR